MTKLKAMMLTVLFALGALLVGCSEPGPAEQAGEQIDEGIEAITPDQGPMESMGESMDEAYEEAKESAQEAYE